MNKEILKNISILYVEDEDDVREFTSKTLSALVERFDTAVNGVDGLEKFKEFPDYDIILTDINMPKLNGLEMAKEIKKINPTMPIVVTSAYNDPKYLKNSIEIGINAYAMKPIDLYKLIDILAKTCEPIFLRKQLESINISLESKVQEEVNKVKSILDAQDNMIILTNAVEITNANKKFLDFFNEDSLDEYKKKTSCISQRFLKEEGFFSTENLTNNSLWIEEYLKLNEIDKVVKLKSFTGDSRIFTMNIDNYDNNADFHVISLTDITELKEKSNLFEYQANHDTLTGLFNRHKFKEIYEHEFKRALRYKNDLSIVIFDIDDFKLINDKHGHLFGDEVLKQIASIVNSCVRELDTIVRWGGEEFVVLLPQTNLSGAKNVAEKIRKTVEDAAFTNISYSITTSCGVSTIYANDKEDHLIKRADEALYDAKAKGKNQIGVRS